MHHLRHKHPVPTLLADDAEAEAAAGLLEQLHGEDVQRALVVAAVARLVAVHVQTHELRRRAQSVDGVLVRGRAQVRPVHLQDLVSSPQSPVLGSSSFFVNLVNHDGSQGGVDAAHDAEAQARAALADLDGRLAAGHDGAGGGVQLLRHAGRRDAGGSGRWRVGRGWRHDERGGHLGEVPPVPRAHRQRDRRVRVLPQQLLHLVGRLAQNRFPIHGQDAVSHLQPATLCSSCVLLEAFH